MKLSINPFNKNRQNGDTIVEVLISVTIIAFVLSAAYLLTNHSLQAAIAAREHTEALNYIQGQIERLKSVRESMTSDQFKTSYKNSTSAFCLVDNSGSIIMAPTGATSIDPRCQVDASHPTSGRYNLSAVYIPDRPGVNNPDTFKFSATWERIGGGATQESADIYYRTAP